MKYLLLILLFIPSLLYAATYQIGSDVTDDYVTWTALQAVSPETAGDTVSFRKGETFNEMITVPNSGTAGNVITYTSHGTGNLPIIDAENTRVNCFKSVSKSWFTIKNLDLRNSIWSNIELETSTNFIVEKNYITTSLSHGVMINGAAGGYACSGDIRYNYVNTDDDCFWNYRCTTTDGVKFYGNVCEDTGDDCFDVDDIGDIYVANNTCINPTKTCLDGAGATSSGTYINNICIFDYIPDCSLDSGCFIYLAGGAVLANYTFDNNIYYSTVGYGTDDFHIAGIPWSGSFSQWQALTEAPDANSLLTNPLVDSSLYYVTKQGSPALRVGGDLCDEIDGYLDVGSTWIDNNVKRFRQCPANTGNEWNIGAYGTRGECPVSVKY